MDRDSCWHWWNYIPTKSTLCHSKNARRLWVNSIQHSSKSGERFMASRTWIITNYEIYQVDDENKSESQHRSHRWFKRTTMGSIRSGLLTWWHDRRTSTPHVKLKMGRQLATSKNTYLWQSDWFYLIECSSSRWTYCWQWFCAWLRTSWIWLAKRSDTRWICFWSLCHCNWLDTSWGNGLFQTGRCLACESHKNRFKKYSCRIRVYIEYFKRFWGWFWNSSSWFSTFLSLKAKHCLP